MMVVRHSLIIVNTSQVGACDWVGGLSSTKNLDFSYLILSFELYTVGAIFMSESIRPQEVTITLQLQERKQQQTRKIINGVKNSNIAFLRCVES